MGVDRIAVVTGAGRGIGRASALGLLPTGSVWRSPHAVETNCRLSWRRSHPPDVRRWLLLTIWQILKPSIG